MPRTRRAFLVVLMGLTALAALCWMPSRSSATSSVKSTWSSVYPSSTLLATYDCTVCHSSGTSLNLYGSAILNEWNNLGGTSPAPAIRAVEPLDSDGDGYTNIAEITANTLPGNPASHPTGGTDTTPPSAPTTLTATPVSGTRIDLSWTASTDNVGVTGYDVYRGGAVVGKPTSASYSDTGVSPATTYQYYVVARDAAGNTSAPSSTVSATTPSTAVNGASVVAVNIPSQLIRGAPASVSVTLHNSGGTTWTAAGGYALGSQDPANNSVWGLSRVPLAAGESIAPGQDKTFTLALTAPATAGSCACDWQMIQGTSWFGPIATAMVGVTSFWDVPVNHWAWSYIEAARRDGIVQGFPGNYYQPALLVTRDQMAIYLARATATPLGEAGLVSYTPPTSPTFRDVPTTYGAYKYIEFVYAQNLVTGFTDGTYQPAGTIDRAQMAVFIARTIAGSDAAVPPGPVKPRFSDVAADFWAYKYIEYIAQDSIKVTQGYPDGLYHPGDICTRDQMAVYVEKALPLMK
jgi:hypothetical protein